MPLRPLFAMLGAIAALLIPLEAAAQTCSTVEDCETACAQAQPTACAFLARAYGEGEGVEADVSRSTAYAQRACELGHGPSCHNLGRAYEEGGRSAESKTALASLGRASVAYGRACSAGVARACGEQARLLLWGTGIQADPRGAVALFTKGCSQGDGGACAVLATLHTTGLGVQKDSQKAAMYARMGTGEPLPLPPLPDARAATLRVVTEPPGLPVTVDGMLAGASPVTVQVPAGLHRVEARHQDLGPQAETVTPAAGREQQVVLSFPATLEVVGSPAGASVAVDGQLKGPLPWKGTLPPGQHELFVTAEAHAPNAARVSLLPGSTLKHEVRLELLPSRLRIASEPAGAELFVDGKRVGVTPWEGDVVTGPHSLKLQLAGHLPATRSLPAERPGQVSEHRFTLQPEPVELKLTSDPVGAEVWVDGRKVGITPYTGKVSPGPHRVELKRPGFDPVETVLQVAAGRALIETKTLVPRPVAAEITSTPEGASVRIDGREVGRTPWKGVVLPGPHALETVLEGHEPGRQAFVVAPAQPHFKAHHRLKAQPATLRVESEPAGADVLIDGKKVGVTPYRGPVAAGAHKLVWRKAGYASQELAVQAAPGKELSQHRKLEPTPIAVSVASRPVGAELRIDGKALGKTPWKGTLAPGRHQLELSLEGHETTREDFSLAVGQQPLALAPTMKGRAVPFGVESDPRGAEVFVDGNRVGTTPFNGTLEPGAHQVVWKKHGHAPAEAKVVAVAGRPISERRTLAPLPVAVEVVSTPAGAMVQLDGKPQGKTPWKGSVAPGAHELVVELAGHRSARQSFTLEPGQGTWKASPTLTREPVAARVESTPAGAEVRIDGRKVGLTPWTGEVPAEPFQLALLKDGHTPLELPIRPIAGRPIEEKHTLVPAPVVLRVKSEPAGAELRVDGKRVGTTPWEGPVAPGAHTLALALAHHAPAEAPVTVEVGRSAEQVVKLTPLPVFLSVQASPESAEIFVDGKRQGTSPVRVELVPGEHTIAVRAEAHSPRGETLTLAPGSAEVQRSYRLSPADVPLRVAASPEGAEVWLDGARVGNVPWEGKVSVGTHAVQVRAAGHAPAEVSVEAKPGEPLQQQLALDVLPVPVELRTKPEGAQVQIDGAPRGTTPVRVELMPGTHALELTARDHETVKATRELKPGTGETWTFDLAQSPVEVALELRPATAQLTVGGQVQKAGTKVLSLLPGKHQLVATLDKHTTVERELVVTRAEGQKISLLLVPALDGPLPPVAPTASAASANDLEALRRILADPKAQRASKARALQMLAPQSESLAQELARVQPKEARGQLCLAWAAHFPHVWLEVETVDAFGDPTTSPVNVHGQEVGQAPLRVRVPVCVEEVATATRKSGNVAAQPVELQAGKETSVKLRLPGRPALATFSFFGEAAQTLQDYGDGQQVLAASGLRYEYFGRVFHFSLGLKGFAQGANLQALEVQRFPLADATIGVAGVLGGDGMRLHVGLGVGVWSLVVPTARLSLGLNFGDMLYLSANVQAHVAHPALLPDSWREARYRAVAFESFVYPSAGVGLGWVFR